MNWTKIFYHSKQKIKHNFISVQKIPEFIKQSGRVPTTFKPFTKEDIYLAHNPTFVDNILDCKTRNGFGTKDPELNQALMYSNASLWEAVEYCLENNTIACSASQGFHHAHFESAGGYCTFNGLVIASIKALQKIEKVLIIDGDAHYGDGTEDCLNTLKLTDRVINVTRDEIGSPEHRNFSTSDWEFFTSILLSNHKPSVVIYQAGADAWDRDPYDAGYLNFESLLKRDAGIFKACKDKGIPLAWNLAGGYSDPMQKTIDIHLQTLNCSDACLNS